MSLRYASAPAPETRTPAPERAPQAAPALAEPDAANSEVLSLVTDAAVDEEPASLLLDLALPAAGDTDTGGTAWAAPLEEEVAPAVALPAPAPARRPDGKLGPVWDDNQRDVAQMNLTLSRTQKVELADFRENYEKHAARYEAVSKRTGVPPMLIAALHYRESSMDFGAYLHQGDPLGKAAVHVPRDIPVFSDWEEAAVHALGMKESIRESVGLTADSRDGAAMATYAEAYNGLGYENRGLASPYVFAGSDRYTGGKYVGDHKFSATTFDRRLGVATILQGMGALDPSKALPREAGGGDAWQQVLAGDRLVRQDQRGGAVVALQERLAAAGYPVDADGVYGQRTAAAVRRFQQDHGLEADGVIGVGTAAALQKRARSVPAAATTGPAPAAQPTTPATPDAAPVAPTPVAAPGTATSAPPAPADVAPLKAIPLTPRETAWAAIREGSVLERGAEGEAVRALQERLRARGYAIRIDGDFGPATRAAVYDLQASLGVAVDGGVGPETSAALDEALGR